MKRVHGIVSGRVQGVYYRKSAEEKASTLEVTGWIRNLPDGRVEFEVQGESPRVDDFLRWSRRGSGVSRVDELEQTDIALTDNETGFITLFED